MTGQDLARYCLLWMVLTPLSSVHLWAESPGTHPGGMREAQRVQAEIKEIIGQFDCGDETGVKQDNALSRLQAFGFSALPLLCEGAREKSAISRIHTANAIQEILAEKRLKITRQSGKRPDLMVYPLEESEKKALETAFVCLTDFLKDSSPVVKIRAIDALRSTSSERATAAITGMIGDPDPTVRASACVALLQLDRKPRVFRAVLGKEPQNLQETAELLGDFHWVVRREAEDLLRKAGAEAIPHLLAVAAARERYGIGATIAVGMLVEVKEERVIPLLADLIGKNPLDPSPLYALESMGSPAAIASIREHGLGSGEPQMRRDAALILLRHDRDAAVAALRTLLGSDRSYLRFQAAEALVGAKERDGIPVLIEFVQDREYRREANRILTTLAGKRVGSVGGIFNPRNTALRDSWRQWWEENKDTFEFRQPLATAIPEPPAPAPPLPPGIAAQVLRLSSRSPEERIEAIVALGAVKEEPDRVAAILVSLLHDNERTAKPAKDLSVSPTPAIAASRALVAIGRPAVGPLTEALRRQPDLRSRIIEMLAQIKYPAAIDALIPLLAVRDAHTRSHAAEALRRIAGQDFGEDAAQWKDWWEKNKADLLKAR